MIGIKNTISKAALGIKRYLPHLVAGIKTYGSMTPKEAVGSLLGKSAMRVIKGIVNDSNGPEMQREPMKGDNYKPPKKRLNIEKTIRPSGKSRQSKFV